MLYIISALFILPIIVSAQESKKISIISRKKKITYCIFFKKLISESCAVNQECIPIKECPYTRKLFAQVKSTNDSQEKANLIQAIRVRVCGSPTDRSVCCDLEQESK